MSLESLEAEAQIVNIPCGGNERDNNHEGHPEPNEDSQKRIERRSLNWAHKFSLKSLSRWAKSITTFTHLSCLLRTI